MVKKKVKKKVRKWVDPMTGFATKEIDVKPLVDGAKVVGKVGAEAAKRFADVVFPSHEAALRKKRKEIDNLEQEIALVKLMRKREKLLKELQKAEE